MATEVTKTSSNKGGECVIVNGYKFCKGYLKENNSKIVWRCSIRNFSFDIMSTVPNNLGGHRFADISVIHTLTQTFSNPVFGLVFHQQLTERRMAPSHSIDIFRVSLIPHIRRFTFFGTSWLSNRLLHTLSQTL